MTDHPAPMLAVRTFHALDDIAGKWRTIADAMARHYRAGRVVYCVEWTRGIALWRGRKAFFGLRLDAPIKARASLDDFVASLDGGEPVEVADLCHDPDAPYRIMTRREWQDWDQGNARLGHGELVALIERIANHSARIEPDTPITVFVDLDLGAGWAGVPVETVRAHVIAAGGDYRPVIVTGKRWYQQRGVDLMRRGLGHDAVVVEPPPRCPAEEGVDLMRDFGLLGVLPCP